MEQSPPPHPHAVELATLTRHIRDQDRELTRLRRQLAQCRAEHAVIADVQARHHDMALQLQAMRDSTSWRITAPLRRVATWVRRLRPGDRAR